MSGFGRFVGGGVAVAISLTSLISCRKPKEAEKSELGEAGYQITAKDWFRAARGNDVPALKKFVAAGFAADTRDEAGDSALHAAAGAGAQNAARYLLDRKLPVDLKGAADRTPLMSAVLGDQAALVRWLLRQGADPQAKDKDGFSALMLAVREGKPGAVAELAPCQRENLDSALLLASLVGQTKSIDTLTNYGASVYARMEDGRTPLMLAAQNGHEDAVKLLLDIGASRFSTDAEGHTAAELATTAGHPDLAALITREPLPAEMALESPAQIAKAMDDYVDAKAAGIPKSEDAPAAKRTPQPAVPIEGEVLSATVANHSAPPESPARTGTTSPAANPSFPLPPLVMRHYRERELPVEVRTVEGETATLDIKGSPQHEIKVHTGDTIPGSRIVVLRVQNRVKDSKLNLGKPTEVSVVEVRDEATGTAREWISGVPPKANDPVALIEDAATGKRYTAVPGQHFKSADGAEFIISDVRPNQLIIQNKATGAVQTLPLRGPRG